MRQIKFRIWNKTPNNDPKEKPIMHYDVEDWAGFGSICKGEYPSLIPMQFTGLNDKNGKEIFDGDILKVKWSIKNDSIDSEWTTEDHIAGAEWCRSGWVIRWSFFRQPFEIDGNKELCWYEEYHNTRSNGSFQKLTDFEVLGNIYENPELLNA